MCSAVFRLQGLRCWWGKLVQIHGYLHWILDWCPATPGTLIVRVLSLHALTHSSFLPSPWDKAHKEATDSIYHTLPSVLKGKGGSVFICQISLLCAWCCAPPWGACTGEEETRGHPPRMYAVNMGTSEVWHCSLGEDMLRIYYTSPSHIFRKPYLIILSHFSSLKYHLVQ